MSCYNALRHLFLFGLLLLGACQNSPRPTETAAPAGTVSNSSQPIATNTLPGPAVLPTATLLPPTPTTEPLAAMVNGQPIYLADYEQTLARVEQGSLLVGPAGTSELAGQQALNLLIERILIAEAAAANGITITSEMVEERFTALLQEAEAQGGEGSFAAWLTANQLTEPQFRADLAYEMLVSQVAQFVTADVPAATLQVHARYLQVDDPTLAQSLLDQVRAGADFATLAQNASLDRATGENGGDLGFFPAGTLLVPEVEAAAFALSEGQTSEVIAVNNGDGSTTYYLVQVIEIDPQRPLPPELQAIYRQQKFESWLAQLWAQATIEMFINNDG